MKPILFNTDMVRAILDGRKTVTRRVVKFKPGQNPQWTGYIPDGQVLYGSNNIPAAKAPYRAGDILYVRKTWTMLVGSYLYRADQKTGMKHPGKWLPSIHMPKEAARLFLRVTDVRAERLQDIFKDPPGPKNQVVREGFRYGCDFIATWQNTMSRKDWPVYGWNANPLVWVIEFERVSKEAALKGGDG